MRTMRLSLFVAAIAATAGGQALPGSYAGQEARQIKALSPEEAGAYAAGEGGMGFAKAAELNHYPGPWHVLELAGALKLSGEQEAGTRTIHARMRGEAVRLGKAIIEKERDLDTLFAERRIVPESLARATAEIARLQGELRATHLVAHLETRALLTPAQVAAYDKLRGYGKREHSSRGHHDAP